MGCGCNKKKTQGATATQPLAAGKPRVLRAVSSQRTVAAQIPGLDSQRPFSRRRYYVLSEKDGTETSYNTLAEAQSRVRTLGSGHRIEARRESE